MTDTITYTYVDTEHTVRVFAEGVARAAAWGPAADGSGDWFVRIGAGIARRVPGRDAAATALHQQFGVPPAGGSS